MNFKTLKHPLIWCSIIAFLIHQILEKNLILSIPILHSYMDDFLCMPIVLGVGTQIIQWIHPARELYYLDKTAIVISIAFYSIVFEAILPLINPLRFIPDWIDIIMYSTGGILYYYLISKKTKTKYERFVKDLK